MKQAKRLEHSGKGKPALSIIIPAYNEEKYLPKLLDSIKVQDFKNFEIIVAIKPSKDNTLGVAKKYGCIVHRNGGLPGLSRNRGASLAKAGILLFLDADTILPKGFLSELMAEFKQKKLDCATVQIKPISRKLIDKAGFMVVNSYNRLTQKIRPLAPGCCIMIKSSTFRKIGGFDESLLNFEDLELAKEAGRHGKFSNLRSPQILVSVRRLEKEGRIKFVKKGLSVLLLYALLGKKKVQSRVKYEFGKF
jgi:glycosyltransferase involved in cell wall biosynthesis